MAITAEQVKELRLATSAPMLDCKRALEASQGDFDRAVAWLRDKGLAAAAKKAAREARNGVVELYAHGGGRVGVMVEVNCETDFVARTEQFRTFAHEVALQIAAANPRWLSAEEAPAEDRESGRAEGLSLLQQPYIRDERKSVGELLQAAISSIGENIVIRRFARWELGEDAATELQAHPA